jgi:hypothetical protein
MGKRFKSLIVLFYFMYNLKLFQTMSCSFADTSIDLVSGELKPTAEDYVKAEQFRNQAERWSSLSPRYDGFFGFLRSVFTYEGVRNVRQLRKEVDECQRYTQSVIERFVFHAKCEARQSGEQPENPTSKQES